MKRRAAALVAGTVAMLACAGASGITRTTIIIDSDFSDWAPVLHDPRNVIVDAHAHHGDPDMPPGLALDLRTFAATWDTTHLYLYFRRTHRFDVTNPVDPIEHMLAYLDLDDDLALSANDLVIDLGYRDRVATEVPSFRAYRYQPAAIADALTGDGVDEPGSLGTTVATDLLARASPSGIEFEAAISWSSLGLAPGVPLNIHPAIAREGPLPDGVEDNGGLLTTRFFAVTLTPNGWRASASPGTVDFPHVSRSLGNRPDIVNLIANSPRGFMIELFTDPDRDGDPVDGILLAMDINGNGIYNDPGDVLASDTDADRLPDAGVLPVGSTTGYVLRVTIPLGVPTGTEDAIQLAARSAGDPTAFATVTDTVAVGAIVVSPDRSKLGVANDVVWFPHDVCNLSGVPDRILLTAISVLGWPVEVWSDPNRDGDPVDGRRITTTGLLSGNACVSVVLLSTIPATAPIGTIDLTRVIGRLALQLALVDDATDRTTVATPLTFAPDRSGVALAGQSAFYPAVITNARPSLASLDLLPAVVTRPPQGPDPVVVIWSDPNRDGDPADGRPIVIAGPVDPNGGSQSVVIEVRIPSAALPDDSYVIDTTAVLRSDRLITATVRDDTAVRLVATYADPLSTQFTDAFARCSTVYVRAYTLNPVVRHRFEWYDPVGALVRVFPNDTIGILPDVDGRLTDALALDMTDPDGLWSVTVLTKNGTSWQPVTPGGTASFAVSEALVATPAIISSLTTDKLIYVAVGDNLQVTSVVDNPSVVTYFATSLEYVVFQDDDNNLTVDPGEMYITPIGAAAPWLPGDYSCRLAVPNLLPRDRILDSSCQVMNITFPTSGLWTVLATWTTSCGSVIDTAITRFNVDCQENELPVTDAGADRAICLGESTVLGTPALPGVLYEWTPVLYLDDSRAAMPVATPPFTSTWQLVAVDSISGCAATDTVDVIVNPLPRPDAGPAQVVCGSESVIIGSDPGPGVTCLWSPAIGLSSTTACQPLAAPPMATLYVVQWTNTATGCSAFDATAVFYQPPPLADAGPDVEVCIAGSAIIGTPAQPGLIYRWSPAVGLTDPDAAQTVATPMFDTTYTLTVTEVSTLCESTATVNVLVAPRPQVVVEVKGIRSGPSRSDVEFHWTIEPLSLGGYRGYVVTAKTDISVSPTALGNRVAFTTTTSAADVVGRDFGRAPGPGGELLFYQVVGLCPDQVGEGPL